MNDFTKAELLRLHEWMMGLDSLAHDTLDEEDDKLHSKIQSMIDNYCEHDKDVWPLYTPTGDIPCAGFCYECNRSVDRVFINDNQ